MPCARSSHKPIEARIISSDVEKISNYSRIARSDREQIAEVGQMVSIGSRRKQTIAVSACAGRDPSIEDIARKLVDETRRRCPPMMRSAGQIIETDRARIARPRPLLMVSASSTMRLRVRDAALTAIGRA